MKEREQPGIKGNEDSKRTRQERDETKGQDNDNQEWN